MGNNFKRLGAMLMALIMVFTMLPVSVLAADGPTVTMNTAAITDGTVVDTSVPGQNAVLTTLTGELAVGTVFYVPVMLSGMTEFNAFDFKFEYGEALQYIGSVTSFKYDFMGMGVDQFAGQSLTYGVGEFADNPAASKVGYMTANGIPNNGTKPIFYAGFKVIAQSATGAESITIQGADEMGKPGISMTGVTADDISYTTVSTVAVEKMPASGGGEGEDTTLGFDIWYELSGSSRTDSGDDLFTDYNIGDTVTATVKLKNNSSVNTYLQAYDLYLTYDSNLTYTGTTIVGAEYKDGNKLTHIQAVGADSEGVVLPAVKFDAGEEVTLGTITFTINTAAVYDTKMPITLTVGKDSKIVTNIGVGGADGVGTGDSTSYYPVNTGTVDGAEVMTTYTVSYNANGGAFAEGAVTTQVKQYNVALTIAAPATPTRTGYSFLGWSTEPGEDNSKNAPSSYTANEDEILYAVWKQDVVTVTWLNADGTTFTTTTVNYGAAPVAPSTNPSKAEDAEFTYTFGGWAATENGTKIETFPTITENTTYYPLFTGTVRKYTVTWKNGDTTLETDENVVYGTAPAYNGAVPTKDQTVDKTFAFDGWSTDPNATTGTAVEDLPTVSGETIYYAIFTDADREYTVTFNANGHGTAPETQSIAYGNKATAPADLTAEHYTFGGWYKEAACTNVYDFSTETITGDTTIYAKWTPISYTITFVPGEGGAMDDDASTTMTYTIEAAIVLPTASMNGVNFGGWQLAEAEGSWLADTYNGTVNAGQYGNITLTAVWTDKPLTVDKNVTNGDVTVANSDGASGNKANAGDTINVTLAPANGYEFGNAATITVTHTADSTQKVVVTKNDDGTYSFTMPDADVTVNVTYTAKQYSITYDLAGGSADGNPATYTIESDDITLIAPTKTGYTFAGWTGSNGTTAQTEVIIAKGSTENKNYTATWTAIEYNITYDLAGGSATGNPEKYTIESDDITLIAPTKTGYTFAGWTGSNGDTAQTEVTIVKGSTEDKSYTATWNPNTDTTYKVNHYQQNYGAAADNYTDGYTLKETDNLTGTTDSKVTPDRKNYSGFTAPDGQEVTIAADGSTVVNYYYTRAKYTITYHPNGAPDVENDEYTFGDTVGTLPGITRPGYTFDGWYDNADLTGDPVTGITPEDAEDKNYYAKWTPTPYTITLNTNGGIVSAEGWTKDESTGYYTMTYTIETEPVNLPVAEKSYYTFKNWKVENAVENWAVGEYEVTKNGEQINYTGKYGNVTLTAQWNRAATPVLEEYKYAADGFWMLRVDAANVADGKEYKFDGQSMFYMEKLEDGSNETYMVDNGSAVFYTLISTDYLVKDADGNPTAALTDEGYNKLTIGDAAENGRVTITYNGDVNGDKVINIADANIVYQMTLYGGKYYGNLSIAQRLAADMDKAAAEKRASIADVDAIVAIINTTT